jgi:hypothetical protein
MERDNNISLSASAAMVVVMFIWEVVDGEGVGVDQTEVMCT